MPNLLVTKPHADHFAMPAEWAPHAQCWMVWPERTDNWREHARPAQAAFAEVANIIAEYEPLTMCVSAAQFGTARTQLSGSIRLIEMTTNDAWMRDVGPTFVRNDAGVIRAVDWVFNAWGGLNGGLYSPWDADDVVAQKVADIERVDRYRAPFVLEGGAIHVDGEGTCLTTEECLLNPNRNPCMSRAEIEAGLREYLGVRTVIWLGQGIYQDETSGHVDNLCCFLRPGVVALATCDDPADPQHQRSEDAYRRLREATDARGRRFDVIRIPVPSAPITRSANEQHGIVAAAHSPRVVGQRLAASYINFLIINGAVVVPAFGDTYDRRAQAILVEQFPRHQIRAVAGREILLGGGNVHCITQQQPA